MPNSWRSTGATPLPSVLAGTAANVHEVDPVSRIEGHLGVKVVVDPGTHKIVDANAHGNMWSGFENFMLGREPNDAITFVQRICGVCPVPHGMTSTYAVDTVLGYSDGHITFESTGSATGVPAKAVLIRNLVLAAEFLMSSITHFYHLAAPSYVQGPAIPPWTPYFGTSFYHVGLRSTSHGSNAVDLGTGGAAVPDANPATLLVWDAVIISYVRALKIRRLTFEAGALFAGRMPMTSCYVAGGVTFNHVDADIKLSQRISKFRTLIQTVGDFIIKEYVPIALVLGMLYQDFDSNTMDLTNPGAGVTSTSTGYGAGLGRFLAWGAFPQVHAPVASAGQVAADTLAIGGGVYQTSGNTYIQPLTKTRAAVHTNWVTGANSVPNKLTEDIAWSRYGISNADKAVFGVPSTSAATIANATTTAVYPGSVARTRPDRVHGYSYMKAPRWNGQACEVGPLARMAVNGFYPTDGTHTLASTFPGYGIYANAGALDAGMVAATIVAALVNTGPVLDTILSLTPGTIDLVACVQAWALGIHGGLSTMDRLRARALESLYIVQLMVGSINKTAPGTYHWNSDGWIDELAGLSANAPTCNNITVPLTTVQGWGATEAPRGALMHQITISSGKITAYQCIVPTTWNGSPKDTAGNNGAMEAACIGAPFNQGAGYDKSFTSQDGSTSISTTGGVEVARIAQSFDPCIACAVH